jgi:glycosyltransferase involved in cell wall biosynthesis
MNNIEFPLVSVSVLSYNNSKYVIECLESVKNSDYPYLELIVIDDGSTDNSVDLVNSWLNCNNSHFKRAIIVAQENVGVCKAANNLIKLAQGDIIVFVASDDALLPSGISLRVAALQANNHWLAIFGDAAMIDVNSKIICREMEKNFYKANKKALADPRFISAELILRWCVPGPVFAAWKKTYDPIFGIGMYNEDSSVEDRDFYLRLLSRNALGYLADEVALYRYVPNSLSKIKGKRNAIEESLIQSEENARVYFSGKEKLYLMIVSKTRDLLVKKNKNKSNYIIYLLFLIAKIVQEFAYKLHSMYFKFITAIQNIIKSK